MVEVAGSPPFQTLYRLQTTVQQAFGPPDSCTAFGSNNTYRDSPYVEESWNRLDLMMTIDGTSCNASTGIAHFYLTDGWTVQTNLGTFTIGSAVPREHVALLTPPG